MANRADNIDVGDIITTRYSGYHKVIAIEADRQGNLWRYHFKKVADAYGKPCKGKAERKCHHTYCKKVTEDRVRDEFDDAVQNAETKRDSLLTILGV